MRNPVLGELHKPRMLKSHLTENHPMGCKSRTATSNATRPCAGHVALTMWRGCARTHSQGQATIEVRRLVGHRRLELSILTTPSNLPPLSCAPPHKTKFWSAQLDRGPTAPVPSSCRRVAHGGRPPCGAPSGSEVAHRGSSTAPTSHSPSMARWQHIAPPARKGQRPPRCRITRSRVPLGNSSDSGARNLSRNLR